VPSASTTPSKEALLFVDCFARYFEPENARATRAVLEAGGYTVVEDTSRRPLCCGRTFLSAGLVEPAREELIVADGTSCRHQIDDGANRKAVHVARVLESALAK
jgi:Fe-S oxidoreductase